MVRRHQRLNGQECEQIQGDSDGQGSLVCCSPWGSNESDTTEQLNNNIFSSVYILSHFSRVRLFAALWTVAHQALLSMGSSRQEHWGRLPCTSPGTYLFSPVQFQFSSVAQSCPTLCDPMDCTTPGLSVHHQLLELTQTHVH